MEHALDAEEEATEHKTGVVSGTGVDLEQRETAGGSSDHPRTDCVSDGTACSVGRSIAASVEFHGTKVWFSS